jgi:hypothetical protein
MPETKGEIKMRNSTRKGQPLERRGNPKTHSTWMEDESDYRDDGDYQSQVEELKSELRRWITNVTIVSYGAIGRRYGETYSSDVIDAAIRSLSNEGTVQYHDYKPAPQMIKLINEADRQTKHEAATLGFNNQPRDKFDEMVQTRVKKTHKARHSKAIEDALAA